MAVNKVPVLKRCRALGLEPYYLGVEKKSSRNVRQTGKKSEYALQLREKQKAKFIYGVLEKPFRNYYEKAAKTRKGITGENLLILLERRLDNVVFRLGFGRTRRECRQLVSHKSITVNGKPVNIPSFLVKPGYVIEVAEKARNNTRFKEIAEVCARRVAPDWLELDRDNWRGVVKSYPIRQMIDIPVNETLIVELYSK